MISPSNTSRVRDLLLPVGQHRQSEQASDRERQKPKSAGPGTPLSALPRHTSEYQVTSCPADHPAEPIQNAVRRDHAAAAPAASGSHAAGDASSDRRSQPDPVVNGVYDVCTAPAAPKPRRVDDKHRRTAHPGYTPP